MVNISVLVATYNGEKYINEQIQSLLSQTIPPFEIVISDDCSSDETINILENIKSSTKIQIRIFQNKQNKGFQKNFFDAFDYCRGEYIALCDQDDVWFPEKLQRINKIIDLHNYPGMVFSDCELVDENLDSLGRSGFEYLLITEAERNHIRQGKLIKVLLMRPCVTGMTMVCRAEPLKLHKPKIYNCLHDYFLSAAFALNSDYVWVEEKLVKYRQHSNNIIGMDSRKRNKRNKRSFTSLDYKTSLLNDLIDRRDFLEYITRFNIRNLNVSECNDLVLNELGFTEWRIERRLSFIKLFRRKNFHKYGYPANYIFHAYIKDFRRCLKIKIHDLFFQKIARSDGV